MLETTVSAGRAAAHDSLTDMDGQAADVVAAMLDLPGVETDAYLDVEPMSGVPDRRRAPDRACGTVERREEAVAGRLDLLTAERGQLVAYPCVVRVEEFRPTAITHGRRPFRRADDVGEHHRREHAVGFLLDPSAGEEGAHLFDDRLGVTGPREVVRARQLDVARPWDLLRHPLRGAPVHDAVAVPVQHERRHVQRRQHVTHVDLEKHLDHRRDAVWAHRSTAVAAKPLHRGRILTE